MMIPTKATGLALLVGAVLIAAIGAGGMYVFLQRRSPSATFATQPGAAPAAGASQEIAITLTPGAVSRAGIQTARPALGQLGATIVVPGIVEANGYKQVVVRSVAAGQVRSVAADLGTEVRRGAVLATIHSPDLAETQRAYLSMEAELSATRQRLLRIEGLVKIGAASQQELETTKAEFIRRTTEVESAQAKLSLLGVTTGQPGSPNAPAAIDSKVRVTSPIDGVIIARTINEGANIDASTDLFTVVDLSAVWVVANLYERDLSRVHVGSATKISAGAGGRTWEGQVSYIDPHLAHDTRTAQVRIDVANPGGALRLGMYTDVVFSAAAPANALLVPRTAIQTIGSQTVVYVSDAGKAGRYVERPVALGSAAGLKVEVLSGLSETDTVVIAGSFMLRAERDRLGFPPPGTIAAIPTAAAPTSPPRTAQAVKEIEIQVAADGFSPSSINVTAGTPIDLVFIRRTDDTCAKEVVFPQKDTRLPLPLNQRVQMRLTFDKPGTFTFMCGMNMLKGSVVVSEN